MPDRLSNAISPLEVPEAAVAAAAEAAEGRTPSVHGGEDDEAAV